jgi:flagellar biosynthetic protein FliR
MLLFNLPLVQLQTFFLIFLRVGAIMLAIPLFDSRSLPPLVKVGLALAVSVLLFPLVKSGPQVVLDDALFFGLRIAGEIATGVIIGLAVKLVFTGIQMAGQIAGFQMGFAIANIMDPATSDQIPILSQFNNLIAVLIFFAINAHHWFLRALVESYTLIPIFEFSFNGMIVKQLVALTGSMFIIAIKIGAPVIAALLLTNVTFGLIARTVPQMHVFIVAMPVKSVVGLLFLGFSLPYVAELLKTIFSDLGTNILLLLRAMS